MYWEDWLLVFYLVVLTLGSVVFVTDSVREKEVRALRIGLMSLLGAVILLALVYLAREGLLLERLRPLVDLVDALATAGAVVAVVPLGRNPAARNGTAAYVVGEVERFDERDQVFARIRSLRPGEREYASYYEAHPERKDADDRRRAMGGPLGRPGSIDRHNRTNLAAFYALSSFPLLMGREEVYAPPPARERVEMAPQALSAKVKGFARHVGADLVGITRLNPAWVYSHRGEIFFDNWGDWGRENRSDHPWAVVVATEMDREMVMARPHSPALLESMRNYGRGAAITTQLAAFLARLGYRATAHHFRHYDLLLVPVAVDAGLGEMGRNGYLITREFGPRVRLAAVTTDAPLAPDAPVDIGIQHFCRHCRKCAVLCPSRSISAGDPEVKNGTRRWILNADSCSAYWARVGTDCSVCMAVCPWSHPRTFTHRVGSHLATRSAPARRLLIRADDLVYGNYRGRWYGPAWCDYRDEA